MNIDVDLLRRVRLFRGLSEHDLQSVLLTGKEIHHEPGDTVVEQDEERGVGFHLIAEGTASITVDEKQIATAGPGEYFGEMSLLDGEPRSATVTAITDLTTFSIPSWHFYELLEHHPSMTKALIAELCDRIRRLSQAVTN
jgi:CRP/FNR family transcriptional regulator, cyclic AMP receptor protein